MKLFIFDVLLEPLQIPTFASSNVNPQIIWQETGVDHFEMIYFL